MSGRNPGQDEFQQSRNPGEFASVMTVRKRAGKLLTAVSGFATHRVRGRRAGERVVGKPARSVSTGVANRVRRLH
jgi:hypothetical protein